MRSCDDQAHLLLLVGESSLRASPLRRGQSVIIGRDPESDLLLFHPEISRRHARIHSGERIEVEDLGSRNGTRLMGRRLAAGERAPLELGRHVQLGPYVAVVLDTASDDSLAGCHAALPIFDPTLAGVPDVVARIARGSATVLVTGEPGVGKGVLARTVHALSGRSGPFVVVSCAERDEALLEEELFGREHEEDGATPTAGILEIAGGGTVFLEEMGDLPPRLQNQLLRVLKSRILYRLGGRRPVGVTARVVASTARRCEARTGLLEAHVRMHGITLAVEPLRARRAAIPALAEELLAQAVPIGRRAPDLGAAARQALMRHDWPGNVRELRAVMEGAAAVCEADELLPAHLQLQAV